jgi:D-amino-acid dehydrogenase
MKVVIVGAGIVGACVAHAMLDAGHDAVMLDREGPASGTSQGNAGWIAHIDIEPLASPKVWRRLPRWLVDPLGPLAIRPSYLPQLVPWLARFIAASRPAALEANTRALIALQLAALPAWERRLEPIQLTGHLRRCGCLSVWAEEGVFAAARRVIERQRSVGIAVELIDAAGVRALEPALGGVAAGALYPAGCHVSDPREFTVALTDRAIDRGARLERETVVAVEPGEGGVTLRCLSGATIIGDRVVLTAGAWSKPLAIMLGDSVPLDTERGYNITLPPRTLGLTRPVNFEGQGFVTTPLDSGDRVGGAVEFGGLEAPPNYARIDAIMARLRRFLPHLGEPAGTRWMGFRPSIPDSLPVIGPARRDTRVIYAFGHGHYGLTEAAITAEMVAALIDGKPPPVDAAPYSAQRFGRMA